jgi:hypothetical protein
VTLRRVSLLLDTFKSSESLYYPKVPRPYPDISKLARRVDCLSRHPSQFHPSYDFPAPDDTVALQLKDGLVRRLGVETDVF